MEIKMTVESDVKIDEKIIIDVKEPPKYNVILLNDDITPMDWVIDILKKIFKHSDESAEYLTLTIHNEGSAIVGTYNYQIAEQKSLEVVSLSNRNAFPLRATIEQTE